MPRRAARALACTAALTAGCANHVTSAATSCSASPDRLVRALRVAPAVVRLDDGTRLSDCVSKAVNDANLQDVGATFTTAAAHLARAAPRDVGAAARLGYLVGAVERGSARTMGFQAELTNRMLDFLGDERLAGAERAAADRGRAAGRRAG